MYDLINLKNCKDLKTYDWFQEFAFYLGNRDIAKSDTTRNRQQVLKQRQRGPILRKSTY